MELNGGLRNGDDEREVAEFERKLRFAMQHSAAPLGLKQRVLARARNSAPARRQTQQGRGWILQRIAASALLASAFGGYAAYRQHEERLKGEEARQQVLTALRITSRALNHAADRVNEQATENSR